MLYRPCEFLCLYVEFTLSAYRGAGELFSVNKSRRHRNAKPD